MLTWIAGGISAVCLIYYAVIVLYAGFSTSFSLFWPLAALFFAALAVGGRYCRLHPKKVPLWASVPVCTLLAAAVAVFCLVEALVFLGAATEAVPHLDYVIVLGTEVQEAGISNSLKKRLDRAIEYSQMNPETVFVLSGGQGPDEPMTEARAMYEYLLYNGVSDSQMLLAPQSTSTGENIAYSRLIIQEAEREKKEKAVVHHARTTAPGPYTEVEEKPLQIGVLTSNFHVMRAVAIAEKWGIAGAHGIAAESDLILFPHLCVRECAAILKDKLMGNM